MSERLRVIASVRHEDLRCWKVLLAIILIFSLLFPMNKAFATPPTEITLAYNKETSSLHVEAIHPSPNVLVSRVRLMVISVNERQVKTQNYYQQNTPYKFWDDVPLQAKVGDVIKVEIYCTLGGSLSQEMTVQEKKEFKKASSIESVGDRGKRQFPKCMI